MTEPDKSDDWLDRMLDDTARPQPSARLLSRVLEDARTHGPGPARAVVRTRPPVWRQALEALGGWGTVGGLVAATCTGFVIGIWSPAVVEDGIGAALTFGQTAIDSTEAGATLIAYGWDYEEG